MAVYMLIANEPMAAPWRLFVELLLKRKHTVVQQNVV